MKELLPARVSSPGDVLAEELEARGWTQSDLATIMGRPLQAISEIIRGAKQITPDTALQLAEVFETSPQLWLNMESDYRLWLAQRNASQDVSAIGRRKRLFEKVPLRELIKRKWIEYTDSLDELEARVIRFLRIPSLDADLAALAARPSYRRNRSKTEDRAAQYAWYCRVLSVAESSAIPPFDVGRLRDRGGEFGTMMRTLRGAASVVSLLRECGIRVVFVPHLPQTYTDGAAFWLDETKTKPVIALTLRYDRIDWFWFTLVHELAHILLGHSGTYIDALDDVTADGLADHQEREADARASAMLIPEEAYQDFVRRCRGRFAATKIEEFAGEIGRHPGIVVGRLQRDGYVQYSHHRAYLEKVKPILVRFTAEAEV